MSNLIITITGPSCTGKSTLAQRLIDTGKFTEIVSTTTRPMRSGDVDGVSYHFVTKSEFKNIEMLETIEFNGNYYGGSVAEFKEKFASGLIPVIVVEPNGMRQININAKTKGWKVLNIFIDVDPQVQARRFLSRLLHDYTPVANAVINRDDFDTTCEKGFNDYLEQFNKIKHLEDKILTEYSNRMASMQTVESTWHKMFTQYSNPSSLYFQTFDAVNEVYVLDKVIKTIDSMS